MTSTAISKDVRFSDETLAGIGSFDDAMATLVSEGIAVETMDDYGTGFHVCDDKTKLVGVPFVILSWRFNDGEFGAAFVSAEIVTKHGDKLIVNDGSTGIKDQLAMVESQRRQRNHPNPNAGLAVPGGLTRSDYKWTDPSDGKEKPATTFYLAE